MSLFAAVTLKRLLDAVALSQVLQALCIRIDQLLAHGNNLIHFVCRRNHGAIAICDDPIARIDSDR